MNAERRRRAVRLHDDLVRLVESIDGLKNDEHKAWADLQEVRPSARAKSKRMHEIVTLLEDANEVLHTAMALLWRATIKRSAER